MRFFAILGARRKWLTRDLRARFDEIQGKLLPFLKGTGYNLKTDVVFIPVSGYTGANLKEPVDRAIAPWVECVAPAFCSFVQD